MGDARTWIVQIFRQNISCNELIEIGKEIAKDKNLKDNHKSVLRNLWKAKYNIRKIDESGT